MRSILHASTSFSPILLNDAAVSINQVMAVITLNKISKIFNGKKEVIKATESSSSIKEMVNFVNSSVILACTCWFVIMNFECKVFALQFYPFTIYMYLCHITLIYYLLLISTLFISLQVADEIQVLQRQGSRKLRKITFELNKHINPARDAARKERYKKIAQKYQ